MSGKYKIMRISASLVVAAMMTAAAAPASAAIVDVTASDQPYAINTSIPTVVSWDPNDGLLRLWDEKQDYELDSNLQVNRIFGTGRDGYIYSGTTISSHIIGWDDNAATGEQAVFADIQFASEVLAVITTGPRLRNSDYLGLDDVTYLSFDSRGLESSDKYELLEDGVTLRINLTTRPKGDWLRVITAANPVLPVIEDVQEEEPREQPDCHLPEITEVPAPAALPAGLAMIAAVAARRRRR